MKFKKFMKQFLFHLRVVARGLARTIYGAFIAGLIAFAIYGFTVIKAEDGYAAVFDFVASCAVLIIALVNAYALGIKRKGGKK